jgi:polysaccharide export outer membrane protein
MTTHERSPRARWALAALAALCGAGCAGQTPYVWVDRLPVEPRPAAAEYRIVPGDVLAIDVWNQEGISVPRALVRDDGKISLAFLQDVEVAGTTPTELAAFLQAKLKAFIVQPVVTVRVELPRPARVSVLGEVDEPGTYEVEPGAGVLRAIAAAGGLTSYADHDAIFVPRPAAPGAPAGTPPRRIRFRYGALTRGEPHAAGFALQHRDVVVVE